MAKALRYGERGKPAEPQLVHIQRYLFKGQIVSPDAVRAIFRVEEHYQFQVP